MKDLFDQPDARPLVKRLSDFGCHYVVELRSDDTTPDYARAEYLDLIPGKRGDRSTALPVHAVVEHQNAPVLYVVDGEPDDLEGLQKQLANRSDAAWLGILRPGELEVRPISFKPKPNEQATKRAGDDDAPLFFQRLIHGQMDKRAGSPKAMDYVAKLIFDQLMVTARRFVPAHGTTDPTRLTGLEVLSMCGRALFFRFLIDRKIVVPDDRPDICEKAKDLKDVFSNVEKAAQTSAWLDATFNGDFLRLFSEQQDQSIPTDDIPARTAAYRRYYKTVHDRVGADFFDHLRAILKGWIVSAKSQAIEEELDLDWSEMNFAHVPVGVLSQVYESYSHWVEGEEAKKASVHYTPLPIARLMVDQCFGPGAVKDPAHARVLDPACGAGIFLVLAFRRLIQKRWEHDEQAPDTKLIRKMLREQLTGFDVSESALRLAALSLYITAIEMDPKPHPVNKLRFDDLRGTVLHSFRDPSQTEGFQIGSLGENVPQEFDAAFDLVIGNPPWTRIAKTIQRFTDIGRMALKARKDPNLAALAENYENPDNNPDLPFLWRATMWAKPEATIALALPARLILHAMTRGSEAWQCVLQALKITGLINGAELRWSQQVWEVKVPFCLLFARNCTPTEHKSNFAYAVPLNDKVLNRAGRFRIDYQTVHSLNSENLRQKLWLLKALQVGTWRGVEILESIQQSFPTTLADIWHSWDPEEDRTGLGFNRSPDSKQEPASWLADMKVFVKPEGKAFLIPHNELKTYSELWETETAHRPRNVDLYKPPVVIVPESPSALRCSPRAYRSNRKMAFSVSYYGYSCHTHPDSELLAATIFLLPHTLLFEFFLLMTSARFGADRQTFKKEELDAIPFPDVSALPAETKATIKRLAHELETNPAATKPWAGIDDFFFQLYQIEPQDVQVMKDTLFSAAPYRIEGKAAFAPVAFENEKDYCSRASFAQSLKDMIQPFFEISGHQVEITIKPKGLEQRPQFDVWAFVAIHRKDQPLELDSRLLNHAAKQADTYGASRVIVRLDGKRGLLLGLLNEQRWWTHTRATFCAQHIVRDYLDAFDLSE
ncbi:MAG: SAM-dependent DNA methyltransferase [Verrucomicrobiaceae bacterium]|nr:SAM-dependent DNA methyltransferase [Verrucomicrobiaceae bacterium]